MILNIVWRQSELVFFRRTTLVVRFFYLYEIIKKELERVFCKNCGKEINDKAVICVHCGVQTGNPVMQTQVNAADEASGGLLAISFLFPIVGLIMGAVFSFTGRPVTGGKCFKFAAIGIVVSGVLWGIYYGLSL